MRNYRKVHWSDEQVRIAKTLYEQGQSLPQISREMGISISTVRAKLISIGVSLRTPTEGMILSVDRIAAKHRGMKRPPFSAEHCRKISESRLNAPAKGTRITSQGYVEFTRGEHKGKREHRILFERKLGRSLDADEIVHHKDGNRANNAESNLDYMTHSDHARLHAQSRTRRRDEYGRFR